MGVPTIRADWANHAVYGGWVGSACACAVLLAALVLAQPALRLAAPAAAVLGAGLAGAGVEAWQWWRNRRAFRAYKRAVNAWVRLPMGDPTPEPRCPALREVSAADAVATLLGGLPPAVPLALWAWGSP